MIAVLLPLAGLLAVVIEAAAVAAFITLADWMARR